MLHILNMSGRCGCKTAARRTRLIGGATSNHGPACGGSSNRRSVHRNANCLRNIAYLLASTNVCPDHQLIVIARDDDTTFGMLHSRFHEAWALRLVYMARGRKRSALHALDDLRNLPFPEGLTPNIAGRRIRRRSARRRDRRGGAAAQRVARGVAEPARSRRARAGGRAGLSRPHPPGQTRRPRRS